MTSPRYRHYGWGLAGALFQLAMLAGYFNGSPRLALVAAVLAALGCIIAGTLLLAVFARRSASGIVLLCVGVGVPVFMIAHARYTAWATRSRINEYRAALPTVLELDRAHCRHPEPDSGHQLVNRCELYEFLPPQFRHLAKSVWVRRTDEGVETFFEVLRGSRTLVVHAPGWSADRGRPYYSLGNGWHTTLAPANDEVVCQRFGIPLLADFNAFVAALRARLPR